MRILEIGLVLLMMVAAAPPCPAAEKPLVVDVWPGKAPGETGDIGEEKLQEQRPNERQVQRLTNVSKPTLTIFRPEKAVENGPAVLIAPGGGYSILAWDLEGEEVARWLNTIGVTGIVLKYRVPRRPGQPGQGAPVGALQDAQRAMSLVRSKAKEWKLDPTRIGMLGFSAGGHLTVSTATSVDRRAYEAIDAVDQVSSRPDFLVLIYPAYLTAPGGKELSPDLPITKETPPTFFAHAHDDPISPENSALMYLALKRAGVPSELHIYTSGGHGFGLRPSEHAASGWPQRCEAWLRSRGIVKPTPAQ